MNYLSKRTTIDDLKSYASNLDTFDNHNLKTLTVLCLIFWGILVNR